MKNLGFKVFPFEIKDADAQGFIRGYASTFGNVDLGLDIVDKGAFKKTIKETSGGKFPILADHDPSKLIGWNIRAEEDETGLKVEGQLDLNVQLAKERYSLARKALEHGIQMGLSIGYMTIKAEPDREKPMVRRLKELKLFEYSIVTFPMNTEAMITAAKSALTNDRVTLIMEEAKKLGLTIDDLKSALQGAAPTNDPSQMAQSIDEIIKKFKQF